MRQLIQDMSAATVILGVIWMISVWGSVLGIA